MAALSKSKNRYRELFDEVLCLWDKYSESYCSVLEEYYEALEAKKANNIRPLYAINKTELDAFPVITLFCIESEDEAIEYLLHLTEDKLLYVRNQMYNFITSKLYNDLRVKASDFRREVRMKKVRKSLYAISPEACGCGKRESHHRLESEFNY